MDQLIWEPEMGRLAQTTSNTAFLNQKIKIKSSIHNPDVPHIKVRDVLNRLYTTFYTATKKKNTNKSMNQILEIIFHLIIL